jgi:hypothetical protein
VQPSFNRIKKIAKHEFLDQMSKIYRYILKNMGHRGSYPWSMICNLRRVVPQNCSKHGFKKASARKYEYREENYDRKIAPVTLQNLMENAIKHNIIDTESHPDY